MKDTTKKFLQDLKNVGFDITNLESQLNTNGAIATAADNLFHGGITRLPEFTKIINEKKLLEAQIAQGHDKLNSGSMTEAERAGLLNHIVSMENMLVDDFGADRNEVEALSVAQKQILSTQNPPPINNKPVIPNSNINPEVNNMNENAVKEMIQTGMAQMGMGSTMLNLNILATMNQFQQMYNRAPTNIELTAFQTAFAREVQGGNPQAISVAGEEAFKFSEKQTEIATANLNTQLEAAKLAGRAEAMKEYNIVGAPKTLNGQVPISPVFARRVSATNVNNTPPPNPVIPANVPPPVAPVANPNGLQLNSAGVDVRHSHLADANGHYPYQRRGTQATRVAASLDFAESNGLNLFDQYGMGNILKPST